MIKEGTAVRSDVAKFEGNNALRTSKGPGKVVDIKTGAELMAKKEQEKTVIELPVEISSLISAQAVLSGYRIKLASGAARDASESELGKIKEMIAEQEAKIAEIKSRVDAMKEKSEQQKAETAKQDMEKAMPGQEKDKRTGAEKQAPARRLSNVAAKLASQRGAKRA